MPGPSELLKNTLVLGANGQVGRLLSSSLLSAGIAAQQVDLCAQPANGSVLRRDILNFEGAFVSIVEDADCICLCLPEDVTLAACPHLCRLMKKGALWLDTLSVKTRICELLRDHAARINVLSINPMFAPALGWSGNSVAVAMQTPGDNVRFMLELMQSWGADTVMVSPEQHDSITAATQVATHAAILSFGETLYKLDYDIIAAMRLCPPPHRILLALLYRVVMSKPDVYWSIQHCHETATSVRSLSMQALADLECGANEESAHAYEVVFDRLRSMLAPASDTLKDWCGGLIDRVQTKAEGASR